jgi:hypothetical protein
MEKIKYKVHDVYLAAFMASHGFPLDLEVITPTKVSFVFTGTREQIDRVRNSYFHNNELQAFVGQIRQMKIALHDRLRQNNDDIYRNDI